MGGEGKGRGRKRMGGEGTGGGWRRQKGEGRGVKGSACKCF